MAEDSARRNPITPQGSILRADDVAYARAMCRPEYPGRVHRMGLESLPVRSTCRSPTSTSRMS
jgi:hypothetical protein